MRASTIAGGRFAVNDVELEVFHEDSGPTMLLLHGSAGLDHRAEFLRLLARQFEVIAPSHPGFGRTALPDRFDSVDDLAYLYLDLADALDLRQAILVGCSLGGWIAAEIAVRSSARFAKLVLTAPIGIKVGNRESRDIPDIFATSPDEIIRLAFHDPAEAAIDFASLTDEELQIIVRNRESLALYTWEPYMHNPKLRYHLDRIRIPTLILRGVSDGLVSQGYVEAYAALIPG
ncbi:MAG TPA: alpha/beta hydrolase, partial [Candidatus Binataceae bacterium]|nr:alpha/beta hydrolase [Candidatus Binataceae bacterium]